MRNEKNNERQGEEKEEGESCVGVWGLKRRVKNNGKFIENERQTGAASNGGETTEVSMGDEERGENG